MTTDALLSVAALERRFSRSTGWLDTLRGRRTQELRAVDGVSFEVHRGETLGLIGESGCGKSTLARTVLRLIEPTAGRIVFDGVDLTALEPDAMREMRRRLQIVFQDPYASLNPRKSVLEIVGLPLRIQSVMREAEIRSRVATMLECVGLSASHMLRFPHQFSGGQRQRIGIARALILGPEFLVCDEPVSALDVSIQAQILKLLTSLKRELALTYLFISHDIGVIGHVCDRVAVMYLGRIVEIGPTRNVLMNPLHPYTKALLSAVPRIDGGSRENRIRLTGDPQSALAMPAGCRFRSRCSLSVERCQSDLPALREITEGHYAACHIS